MRTGRLGTLARGLRQLRRAPDLAALRSARSPEELARLALVPAARNLGIAIGFLPAELKAEATAALLACRVLDAYEDLPDRLSAAEAVLAAAGYLNGDIEAPPPVPHAVAVRDCESVDLTLAERIDDVRALLSGLPVAGRQRVGDMLVDVGRVMSRNLSSTMPRAAYSEGVLGRVVLYTCSLVTENAYGEADLSELAGCIGVIAQLANDLRDGELALYGAGDREELTRAVMLRLLAPAVGGFALLAQLGRRIPSRGARTAMAYVTITTAAFLCAAVGAPAPYRRLRLAATLWAARSPRGWTAMLAAVERAADGAIHRLLDWTPEVLAEAALDRDGVHPTPTAIGPLIVDATFTQVRRLPEEPMTGELTDAQVRRMMIADHLAFGAVERLRPRDADGLAAIARQFQLAALDSAALGARP
jgi:hypothetical protein